MAGHSSSVPRIRLDELRIGDSVCPIAVLNAVIGSTEMSGNYVLSIVRWEKIIKKKRKIFG